MKPIQLAIMILLIVLVSGAIGGTNVGVVPGAVSLRLALRC